MDTKTIEAEVVGTRAPTAGPMTTTATAAVNQLPRLPNLAGALAKAQQKIRAVANDARNDYHKYDYTSSEAIIEAAKDALADNGLALLPIEETLSGWERQGENRFELVCKFILIHTSGESSPLLRHWPVCPEKGKPLDKATAGAATLCLSYLLRDLLLMPRINPQDDVSARDDRAAKQTAPKSQGPPPVEKPKNGSKPPPTGAEFVTSLHALDKDQSAKGRCESGELIRAIIAHGVSLGMSPDLEGWDSAAVAVARLKAIELIDAWKAKKTAPPAPAEPPSPELVALIRKAHGYIAADGRNYSWVGMLTHAKAQVPALFKTPMTPDEAVAAVAPLVTPEQVQQYIDGIEAKLKGKAKKAS